MTVSVRTSCKLFNRFLLCKYLNYFNNQENYKKARFCRVYKRRNCSLQFIQSLKVCKPGDLSQNIHFIHNYPSIIRKLETIGFQDLCVFSRLACDTVVHHYTRMQGELKVSPWFKCWYFSEKRFRLWNNQLNHMRKHPSFIAHHFFIRICLRNHYSCWKYLKFIQNNAL